MSFVALDRELAKNKADLGDCGVNFFMLIAIDVSRNAVKISFVRTIIKNLFSICTIIEAMLLKLRSY